MVEDSEVGSCYQELNDHSPRPQTGLPASLFLLIAELLLWRGYIWYE